MKGALDGAEGAPKTATERGKGGTKEKRGGFGRTGSGIRNNPNKTKTTTKNNPAAQQKGRPKATTKKDVYLN